MDMNECEISDFEKILSKHPGLVMLEHKSEAISLQGPIEVKNMWFNIKLICTNSPQIKKFHLQIQQGIFIKTYTSENFSVSSDWTIEELFDNLFTVAEPIAHKNQILLDVNNKRKPNIYDEIASLYAPTEYEILLNDDFSLVRFSKIVNYEQHFLEVALNGLELKEHSLPSCVDWKQLLGKSTSLSMLLQQFKNFLADLRPFYENFTDIDELCQVVLPPLPNYKENWRLFVLKERVFLKVQFNDPFSPMSSMSVQIIGPTPEVAQLRHVYSEGIRDWDGELDVHKNLLRIFDLCFFPMAPSEGSQDTSQYCNICYCFKLDNGEIPVVSCDNTNCSLIFHATCLKEWFNTLADGKTFLDVVFGSCPFCKAKLSTSFQEILN